MAIREGLFDSTTITTSPSGYPQGDKAETADFFADIIYRILGDGVSLVPTSAMNVITNTGMIVTVKAGVAFKRGYKAQLESDLDIPFTTSASEQIFYIGVRLDEASGEFTDNNVVARTSFVAETDLAFAKITIPASAVVITDAMIEDLRYNSTYCGFVDTYRISLANIYDEFVDAMAVAVAGGIPAHATNHASGGSDPITPESIGALPYGAISSNLLIDGGFQINEEGVSGTVSLSAGEYGHTMWKAGASGCTYTFSDSANKRTVTITAGTLLQIVEGGNIRSGVVCLSWEGTAQARIDSGSYGNSGITGTATGGTNLTVEFGTGTVADVQLNYGSAPMPFVLPRYDETLSKSQRYYLSFYASANIARATYYSSNLVNFFIPIPTTMRASPTVIGAVGTDWNVCGLTGGTISGFSLSGAYHRNAGVEVSFTKTSHGLTDARLQVSSSAAFDARL